ncbi:hypothetical protein ACWGF2_28815 [Streptomyces sp. NPDC054919]
MPRELKVIDTALLLRLEEDALVLQLNQRLPPSWIAANAAPEGVHHLWPALWNTLQHRPELPRQLRCELLIELRSGERVMSLLDVLPHTFAPLPRVTARDEGMRVAHLLETARSVREWEAEGSGAAVEA